MESRIVDIALSPDPIKQFIPFEGHHSQDLMPAPLKLLISIFLIFMMAIFVLTHKFPIIANHYLIMPYTSPTSSSPNQDDRQYLLI